MFLTLPSVSIAVKNYIAVNVVLSVDYTKFFHVIQKGIYTNVR